MDLQFPPADIIHQHSKFPRYAQELFIFVSFHGVIVKFFQGILLALGQQWVLDDRHLHNVPKVIRTIQAPLILSQPAKIHLIVEPRIDQIPPTSQFPVALVGLQFRAEQNPEDGHEGAEDADKVTQNERYEVGPEHSEEGHVERFRHGLVSLPAGPAPVGGVLGRRREARHEKS